MVPGFLAGWVSGGWVSLLGWEGGCDSPRRLLRGSGTVPGFIQVWVRGWVSWWVSPLGWERGWKSLGRLLRGVRNGTRIYTGLRVGWGGLVGVPPGLGAGLR